MNSPSKNNLKSHLIAIGIIIFLCVVYFLPQLNKKAIAQDDSLAFKGAIQENMTFEKQEGRTILWTNSMFGGMPTYQIHPASDGNYLLHFHKVFRLFISGPIGIFISSMLCMYLMLVFLGIDWRISLIGAICFGLTTNTIILWLAGHATKVVAISYLPLITGGFILIFRKKYLIGSILFTIGLALDLAANHIQMTYYFAICLLIFWLIKVVMLLKEKKTIEFLKTSGVLAIGTILAILTTSTNYLSTYEYQKDTMRGDPILESKGGEITKSSETKGLDWEYAMQWSNGTRDVLASLIPGIVGGGSSGETGRVTKGSAQNKLGAPVGERNYSYSGSLPFTSGPAYFGAIICFLFIFGIFILKGPTKWWLVSAIFLTIFMSMGKHFPSLNEFLFHNLPLLNKFRAPNSILGVTAFFIALMAILTLKEVVDGKYETEKIINALKYAGGITAGFCLLVALLGDSLISVDAAIDSEIIKQSKGDSTYLDAILQDRLSIMRKDAWRSFIFIGLAIGSIYLLLIKKLKLNPFIIIIGGLILIDLWGVDQRYINYKTFESKRKVNQRMVQRPVDAQILQDKDLSYRVFDLSVNTFNSATPSYYHQTIGGYSAAKLQRYQDIIENHISKNNSSVIDMLNTKYIINKDQQISINSNALGNAWFIEDIKKVNTPNEELDALTGFRPDSVAIVLDKEFDNYVGNFNPSKNGSIKLTQYIPDELEYKSSSTSEQFAVFSEIWYGPDKGWRAYIDNKEVPFVRANYVLRGMKIPAGEHVIRFEFKPDSYKTGKTLASISSLIILALLIFSIVQFVLKNRKKEAQEITLKNNDE